MSKMTRLLGAACIATGTVAMSGLVASGAAVYSIAEGFLSAGKRIKDALREEKGGELLLESGRPCLEAQAAVPHSPEGEIYP